jgi:hypothetical protein
LKLQGGRRDVRRIAEKRLKTQPESGEERCVH